MSLMCKPEPQSKQVMDRLFLRLTAFYGSKFTEVFGGIDPEVMKGIWAEELAAYTLDELNRGVTACRALKWPPTLPEFMVACRPPVTAASAYHEAIANAKLREDGLNPAYSHPAVYWAAVEIGSWELRHQPYKFIAGRWEATLDRLMRSSTPLEPVPPPPLRLKAPDTRPPSPEIAKRLAELAASLRGPMKKQNQNGESHAL